MAVVVVATMVAVASPGAAQEFGTVTSGQAYNFDLPTRGFLRIIGTFESLAPLDLGAAGINARLTSLLNEDNHGQLVAGLPVTLLPRTRSARVTVLETPAGVTPFYRLTVRTCIPTQEACPNSRGLDVGDYEFRIDGVSTHIARPTECGDPPGPGSTNITGQFFVDDGINPPVEVLLDQPWTCTFLKNRVHIIRVP
jgi:hypothetical protein